MASKITSIKIQNLASAIINLITEHASTQSSSTTQGHSKAGGVPQSIGKNLNAGTDNGYYARADHVHTASTDNITDNNAYNILGTAKNSTQQEINQAINNAISGKQAAGNYATLDHTHGNITKNGTIGSASGKILTTGSNGVIQASSTITKSKISDFPTSMPPTTHTHDEYITSDDIDLEYDDTTGILSINFT